MSTIVLPTDDPGEVVDAKRLKLFAAVGGVVFFILLVFIIALWPTKKPKPAGTPLASAPSARPSIQGDVPESNDPLGFVAPAKPLAVVQRTPSPDGPTPRPDTSPSAAPVEAATAWTRGDKVQVFSKHGLNAPVVATLNAGTRLLWAEDYQNWTRIKLYGGREGWVEKKNLVYEEPSFAEKPTPEEGRQTLTDFYEEVKSHNYAAAYARLSDEWKAELSFTDFQKGFKQVRSLDVQMGETEVMSPLTIRQHVIIEADEEARPRRFSGTYELQYHPIEWRLTSGILEEGGPSNSSVPGL